MQIFAHPAEQVFQAVSQVAQDGLWLVDPQGRIRAVNPRYCEMVGYSQAELLHKSIMDLEAEESPDEVHRCIQEVMEKGQARFERKHRHKNGGLVDVEISTTFLKSSTESLFLCFIRDLTQAKDATRNQEFAHRLTELFTQISAPEDYLQALVAMILEYSGCQDVGIRLLDQQGELPFASQWGLSCEFWQGELLPSRQRDRCLCLKLIEGAATSAELPGLTSQGSFYGPDLNQWWAQWSDEAKDGVCGLCAFGNAASLAILPLRYQEKNHGALFLADPRKDRISLKTVEFLSSMAPMMAEAITRFTVEAELQRNLSKQQVLNDLLSLSLEDLPLPELLGRTLELLFAIPWISLEAKGAIFLMKDNPEEIVMEAQQGLAPELLAACGRLPLGRCLCGRAAASREVQFAACLDSRHDVSYPGIREHGHYCVPILHGNRLLGVINLYLTKGHRRSASEEAFLTAVSHTLAGIISRREAEAAHHRSDQDLGLLVKNVPAVVFKGYPDYSIDLIDDKIEDLTGYPREDFLSRRLKWNDLIFPEDIPSTKQVWLEALKGNGAYVREYRLRHRHGELIWLQERGQIVLDPGGSIEYVSGVFFDITNRKRGEAALREQEERYRALVESAHDAIITANAQGTIVSWNLGAQNIFGYSAPEALGQPLTLLIPERYCETHSRALARLRSESDFCYVSRTLEAHGLRRGGAEFPLELSLAAWQVSQETFFSAIIRDITTRKEAEEELRRQKETAQMYLDVAKVIFVVLDLAQKVVLINKRGQEILGYPEDRIIGRNWFDLCIPEAQRDELKRSFSLLMTGELELFEYHENPIINRQGQERVIAWHNTLLRDGIGKIIGSLSSGEDITDRRLAEAALENSMAQMQRSLDGTVIALSSTLESRDPYTAGHQRRVAQLACALGAKLGLTTDRIEGLRVMGFLHDIGKIAVPAELLSKPGKLSEYEYNLVKTHSQTGYEILKEVEFPWPVATATLQHHERMNGSGYPQGLSGNEIILEARILAVADVVEAMASHRPYRPMLGLDQALEEISRNRSVLYDPEVVDACIRVCTEKGFKFD